MSYYWHTLFIIALYVPLAYSLNLTVGLAGLASFCHAVFYALGAYSYTLLTKAALVPPVLAVVCGIGFTALLALAIGSVSLRFRGDLFLFTTLGFQMAAFAVLYNWESLTNGTYGISGIARLGCFGYELQTPRQFALAASVVAAAAVLLLLALYRSPFGLILKALREDEIAAAAAGIHPRKVYLQAFVISAAIASLPGALYAAYAGFIDPTSFTLKESILQLTIVLLGGAGSRMGPFVGVLIVTTLTEILRNIGMPEAASHNMREIIYGLLLMGLMYWRPQGIAGEFRVP